jgi:hypothetical protein
MTGVDASTAQPGDVTVTEVEPVNDPPTVAVITAVPCPRPVITAFCPLPATVAIASSLEVHVTGTLVSTMFLLVTVAVTGEDAAAPPTVRATELGATTTA